MSTVVNPYAAPQARLLMDEPSDLAPLLPRLAAAVVDTAILAMAIFGVCWATHSLGWLLAAVLPGIPIPLRVTALSCMCFIALQGLPLHTRGQSIGKWLFGLRVVGFNGMRAPSWILILWRPAVTAFLLQLPLLGVVAVLVDALFCLRGDRRCLHDWLTETQVVPVKALSVPAHPSVLG